MNDKANFGIDEDGVPHQHLKDAGVDTNSHAGLLRQLSLAANLALMMHRKEGADMDSVKSLSLFEVYYPVFENRGWRSLLSQGNAERLFLAMARLRDCMTLALAEKEAGIPVAERTDVYNTETFSALKVVREIASIVERPIVAPEATVAGDPAPVDDLQGKEELAKDILIGPEGVRILEIAKKKEMTANDRYAAIIEIDQRIAGWDSPEVARLLGVSASAIRQTPTWRHIQSGPQDD
ncbi:MAG: hypothetical protein KDA52_07720 [Planctomycetaceae bacterium]|nr:hypothetical protein [Planctomycetaceae bacterium]